METQNVKIGISKIEITLILTLTLLLGLTLIQFGVYTLIVPLTFLIGVYLNYKIRLLVLDRVAIKNNVLIELKGIGLSRYYGYANERILIHPHKGANDPENYSRIRRGVIIRDFLVTLTIWSVLLVFTPVIYLLFTSQM